MSKNVTQNLKMSKHNIVECQECQHFNQKCQKCDPNILKFQMSKTPSALSILYISFHSLGGTQDIKKSLKEHLCTVSNFGKKRNLLLTTRLGSSSHSKTKYKFRKLTIEKLSKGQYTRCD